MKAVKFKGDIAVEEVPVPPIPRDHVLIRVKMASVSPLERGLEKGNLWVEPERILGLEGYGIILEKGVEVEEEEGKEVLVDSYADGILGVTREGALAEYLVVPREAVSDAPDVPEYAKALASAGALALRIAEETSDKKTLLIGSGLTNVLASFKLSWEAPLLPWGREISLDLNYFPTMASACTQEWDAVVVSVPEASAVDTATMCVKEGGNIYLHPLVDYSKHVFAGKKVNIEVLRGADLGEGARLVASLPSRYLRELVEEVRDIREAITSSLSRSLIRPDAL
ncbi:MAG: zinc-binding alcohol dehydrogenase family protein [Crenarchaeota archaeon]|nr:zinc-binding alcohol dehydrogenase family protein [Thermoproteota archaeon]